MYVTRCIYIYVSLHLTKVKKAYFQILWGTPVEEKDVFECFTQSVSLSDRRLKKKQCKCRWKGLCNVLNFPFPTSQLERLYFALCGISFTAGAGDWFVHPT